MRNHQSVSTVLMTAILIAASFVTEPRLVAQELRAKATFKGGHDKRFANCRFVAFTPDGKTVVSVDDVGGVNVWAIATQEKQQWVNEAIDDRFASIWQAALSPDGKTLVTAVQYGKVEDQGALRFELTTGKRTGRLGVMGSSQNGWPTPMSVAFSPDGKTVATGNIRGYVVLWDIGAEKEIGKLEGVHEQRHIPTVAFSPDGKTLAAVDVGGGSPESPPNVSVWDVAKRKNITSWAGHKDAIHRVAFVKDGKTVATCSSDHTVKLWDTETGKEKRTLKVGDSVWSMAVSRDGELLAAGTYGGTVALIDLGSGDKRASIEAHAHCVSSIAFSPDGKMLATASHDRTVKIWELAATKDKDK